MLSIERILQKEDEFLHHNDYDGAERHLSYWLGEAEQQKDGRAILFLCNEMIGLHRKLGHKEQALGFCQKALAQVEKMGIEENIGAATTYLNAATAYKAFGLAKEGIPLFEKAEQIYLNELSGKDPRFGGLYNNMGLAWVDLKEFAKAKECYQKALENTIATGSLPEQAITHLNLATAAEEEWGLDGGEQEIANRIDCAWKLLNEEHLAWDGNYAFVCEKCAPTFRYYGYFLYANQLEERAKEIYERS
jgi:tetratricopeptide (TPR) repeat protein